MARKSIQAEGPAGANAGGGRCPAGPGPVRSRDEADVAGLGRSGERRSEVERGLGEVEKWLEGARRWFSSLAA